MAAPPRPLLAVVSAAGVSCSALLEEVLGSQAAVWHIDTKYYSAEAEVEVRRRSTAAPERTLAALTPLRSSSPSTRAPP